MKHRFTVKTLLVVTAFVSLALGWGVDRYRMNRQIGELMVEMEELKMLHEYEILMGENEYTSPDVLPESSL
jgi:hypothetical protein